MKRIRDIVGLSLICVKEGLEYGRIKDVLFDPANGKVKYLIIDNGQWYLGAKLLPFDKVVGIGSDVVTTESQKNVIPFAQAKDGLDLIKREVTVTGSKVYSQKGEYIGEVKEYFISETDGSILECEIIGNKKLNSLPASAIVTFGKGVIIASQDFVNQNESEDDNADELDSDDSTDVQDKESPSELFEMKQRRFLLGKRVTKRVLCESGQMLVDEGEIITDEILDRAKAEGKLVELTMNIESN